MSSANIIVFGATGDVGSAAAIEARKRGANVALSVRDLNKPIPGLSLQEEQEKGFTRVKADLTDPESVHAAVLEAKATRAFIYVVFGSEDKMDASIAALKSAGIELVVFLSSCTLRQDIENVSKEMLVPWSHAQVEMSLEKTFGPRGYIAVRAGFFNSNTLWWKDMVKSGAMKTAYPELQQDFGSMRDIGHFCAALVTGSVTDHPKIVYSYGPELLSYREAVATISKVLGKDIKMIQVDHETEVKLFQNYGLPEPFARYLVGLNQERVVAGEKDDTYGQPDHKEVVATAESYLGRPLTTFETWLRENKHRFEE